MTFSGYAGGKAAAGGKDALSSPFPDSAAAVLSAGCSVAGAAGTSVAAARGCLASESFKPSSWTSCQQQCISLAGHGSRGLDTRREKASELQILCVMKQLQQAQDR